MTDSLRRILVPNTSPIFAPSVINYTLHFAANYGWSIVLLSVIENDESLHEGDERLQELVTNLKKSYPQIEITGECIVGEFIELVNNQIKVKQVSLIITTGGSHKTLDQLSAGYQIAEFIHSCTIPIITVPYSNNFFKLINAGLLSNFHPHEFDTMKLLMFLTQNQVQLYNIHVYINNKVALNEHRMKEWELEARGNLNVDDMHFVAFQAQSIPEGINSIIEVYKLGLLTVTAHSKPIFSTIFKKDLIQHLMGHLKTPLLFVKCDNYQN